MKTLSVKNEMSTLADPIAISITLFNLGINLLFVKSRMMKPTAPNVNMKLDANPSIMY